MTLRFYADRNAAMAHPSPPDSRKETGKVNRAHGGRVARADGGSIPAFDPSKPFEDASVPAFDPTKPFSDVSGQDAGSPPPKDFSWSQTLTDVWPEIKSAAGSAIDTLTNANGPDRAKMSPVQGFLNSGRRALAIPELAASPFVGAYRSLIGHPMANLEHAAGTIINPAVAAKDDPAAMYAAAKADADTAMAAMPGEAAPIIKAAEAAPAVNQVVAAANRVADATGLPLDVPRAFASDNMAIQRVGQMARNVPIVGDSIPRATGTMVDQMGDALGSIASHYGEGSGPNVANRIGSTIQDAADAERTAAQNAARASDDALAADWQRSINDANQSISDREAQALQSAHNSVGNMSPQDMGDLLIQRLRAGEQEARARKDQLYATAGNMDAAIHAGEVANVRSHVAQALDNAGRVIDPNLTPAASRMMGELQRLSDLDIPNQAIGARVPAMGNEVPAAVNINGIEQARKRLSFFRSAAANDADRAAASMIMRNFDDWYGNAFENALFSGDPAAVDAIRAARAANASWRNRFFNDETDGGKFVNRIVEGEVTPQEVSNFLVGASQVGAKGVSSRLLTHIIDATGNDPEALNAIRGGIWNRLSQPTEGASPKAPERVASGIYEFLNGSGRDMANRLFTPEQQGFMRTYADTLRQAQAAREHIASVAATTKPQPMEVGIGPMQELANAVLGRSGRTDEALFSAIDAYARSGAKGDVKTLANVLKTIPEKDRGDLAGAIIRNMGQSKATGEFSPDLFVTEWNKYTPQAKTILFGNAGPHRRALDDIAAISQRYKDVGRRFGNPSGTAQNVSAAGLGVSAASALSHLAYGNPLPTLSLLSGVLGGTIAARVLAAPAGAQKIERWMNAVEAIKNRRNLAGLAALKAASEALAKEAARLGSSVSSGDLMRALQGPVPAGAEDEQKKSPRVGNQKPIRNHQGGD